MLSLIDFIKTEKYLIRKKQSDIWGTRNTLQDNQPKLLRKSSGIIGNEEAEDTVLDTEKSDTAKALCVI